MRSILSAAKLSSAKRSLSFFMEPLSVAFLAPILAVAFWTQGCAHKPVHELTEPAKEMTSLRANEPDLPKLVDQELETIPTEENALVEKWIAYFQGKGRPHMERYLARSTMYTKVMKRILRQNGLPEDLIYIALIESGFNWKATSRAAAVGPWQFIRGTGRRYNLEVNSFIDERRDPIMSTQAAADYFKGLYSVFGSWYLAMASYNVGENRVKREIMNHYTRDFWELARKRRLPRETINYIPKFIAAKLIGNSPAKYGFADVEYLPPMEFDQITVLRPLNLRLLAEQLGLEYDDLKQLNPKFRGEIAPLKGDNLVIRVPVGSQQQALVAAEKSYVDKVAYVADTSEFKTYRVRSGDSLYTIAKRYKTTVAFLKDVNDLPRKRRLRIGMRVLVPDSSTSTRVAARENSEKIKQAKQAVATKAQPPASVATQLVASKSPAEKQNEDIEQADKRTELVTKGGVYYVIQSGDTLSSIAGEYDSSVMELRKMNKLSKGALLKVGMRLRVPKEDGGLPADPSGSSVPDSSTASGPELAKNGSEDGSSARRRTAGSETAIGSIINKIRVPGSVGDSDRTGDRAFVAGGIAADHGSTAGAIEASHHIVQKGENLFVIARKYGVSLNSLRKVNNLSTRTKIRVGAKLVIPVLAGSEVKKTSNRSKHSSKLAQFHVVRRGENLSRIADKYQVSVVNLKDTNRLARKGKLVVGAKLLIPRPASIE